MGNKTKVLLFDFDGVIVDTFRISYESMRKVVSNPPDEEGYRGWFEGNIYETEEHKSFRLENKNYKVDESDPFFKIYTPSLMKEKPVDGIVEAIEKLHKNHRLVVVSSTISSPIKEYLDKYNISRYFEKIYGADIDVNKSSKIRMVFADFNVVPVDCLFITDTLGDMREAKKTGVKSIAVIWGFHKLDTLRKGNPVAIANAPEELLSLIDNTL